MANEKALTKSAFTAGLKQLREQVAEDIREATDAVLEGVENLLKGYATTDDVQGVKTKVDHIDLNVTKIKDQFDGLKSEYSDTPSREEFNKLKARVDRYHSQN